MCDKRIRSAELIWPHFQISQIVQKHHFVQVCVVQFDKA